MRHQTLSSITEIYIDFRYILDIARELSAKKIVNLLLGCSNKINNIHKYYVYRYTLVGVYNCIQHLNTWMISRIKKYVLATLRNCSKRLSGKKEMMLYFEVVTTLFCVQ